MTTCLLNDILYFMSSCFRCKHNFYNGCISVSIDNSMIDFDKFWSRQYEQKLCSFTTAKKSILKLQILVAKSSKIRKILSSQMW